MVCISTGVCQLTLPQSSDATAPPLLVNQVFRAVVLPAPSHSTVMFFAGDVMAGPSVSTIATVACAVAVRPQASVAVKVTRAGTSGASVAQTGKVVGIRNSATANITGNTIACTVQPRLNLAVRIIRVITFDRQVLWIHRPGWVGGVLNGKDGPSGWRCYRRHLLL